MPCVREASSQKDAGTYANDYYPTNQLKKHICIHYKQRETKGSFSSSDCCLTTTESKQTEGSYSSAACTSLCFLAMRSSCSSRNPLAVSALLGEMLPHPTVSPLHCQLSPHPHPTPQSVRRKRKGRVKLSHKISHSLMSKADDVMVTSLTCFTCSGFDMPNPTATGLSVTCNEK